MEAEDMDGRLLAVECSVLLDMRLRCTMLAPSDDNVAGGDGCGDRR